MYDLTYSLKLGWTSFICTVVMVLRTRFAARIAKFRCRCDVDMCHNARACSVGSLCSLEPFFKHSAPVSDFCFLFVGVALELLGVQRKRILLSLCFIPAPLLFYSDAL